MTVRPHAEKKTPGGTCGSVQRGRSYCRWHKCGPRDVDRATIAECTGNPVRFEEMHTLGYCSTGVNGEVIDVCAWIP